MILAAQVCTVGYPWSRQLAWITVTTMVIIASSRIGRAFPLDPVRIFARDRSPVAGQLDVEATVWQGGAEQELDSGRRIYREVKSLKTDDEGHFDFWLGEGRAHEGTLRGDEFGLDKQLRLQLRYRVPNSDRVINRRVSLAPIDNAYIAHGSAIDRKPGANDHLRGVYDKHYDPAFELFSPEFARRGMAILYPDGRLQTEDGSFVETTGTTTSGVQEFFDYCTNHHVDGYIIGGSIPRRQQVVYRIWTPLRIHPAQGIRIDTGAITLQFLPDVGEEPGLTIDSCMMNDIRIRGLLHYLGKGTALAIHPQNPLPLDRFVGNTIVDTAVYVTAIACKDAAGALKFDGSINFSRFEFNELNHGGIGMHVAKSANFSNNRITCKHVHGQTGASILDEGSVANVWEVNLNCDAKNPRGIVTSGRDNLWFANVISRNNPGLILEKPARGNQFFLMGLNGGYENRAENPTNRFFASTSTPAEKLRMGFAAKTPPVPASGHAVTNRDPFPVVVMIKQSGKVTRWELTDCYGQTESFQAPLQPGQSIYLGVGEAIRLHYDGKPPTWRWRAVQ